MKHKYGFGITVSYLSAAFCVGMGLFKMFFYYFSYSYQVNYYVSGDANNYIINAGYATAWFVLAVFCGLIGLTFLLVGILTKNSETGGQQ